jgi:hypothetical protein
MVKDVKAGEDFILKEQNRSMAITEFEWTLLKMMD